jgi:iron complex transport system ATP-binding protein
MAPFTLDGVCFSYRGRPALRDISLDLGGEQQRVVALLGPNGSGKSTLIKVLLGLLQPARGAVRFLGREMTCYSRRELACRLAYVPQLHRESFAYTVAGVVLMGRMPHAGLFSRYSNGDREAASSALAAMGIAHLAERPYTEVSGGERQLTLIARAIAQGARTVVMDEPTNGLDYGHQLRLLVRLGTLAQQGFTFVFSTHHPEQAATVADRVVLLRDGVVVGDGAPLALLNEVQLAALYDIDPVTMERARRQAAHWF